MSRTTLHETEEPPSTDLLTFAFNTVYEVDEQRPIYIDAEQPIQSLNKSQTRTLIGQLIAGFQEAGLRKGECVLVVLTNNVLCSAIQFGIIGAGGVHMGVNPHSLVGEFEHIIRVAQPQFIITSPEVLSIVRRAAGSSDCSVSQFYVLEIENFPFPLPTNPRTLSTSNDRARSFNRGLDHFPTFLTLLEHGYSDWNRFSDDNEAKSTPAAMFLTSGTSGLPKAAILSHYALVSQHLSILSDPSYRVRRLISLPAFHVLGAMFLHIYAVRFGQPTYIMQKFATERFVHFVKHFEITDTYLVPAMLNSLLKSPQPLKDHLQSLRFVAVGGAPTQARMMQLFEAQLHPSATFTQIWGMTEVGAVTFHKYPDRSGCDGSVGKPLSGYEMRLVDRDGRVISEDDVPGDAQVRYKGIMIGYKNRNPHPKGHWFSTKDLMTRNSGKYFVVGRMKDLIKVNGFQVAPEEIEEVLLSHPDVEDAAVVGVMHQSKETETPRAYVIRKISSELSAKDLYQFARGKLASYKALDGGIVFTESIPRTASGKIQRFKLRETDNSVPLFGQ